MQLIFGGTEASPGESRAPWKGHRIPPQAQRGDRSAVQPSVCLQQWLRWAWITENTSEESQKPKVMVTSPGQKKPFLARAACCVASSAAFQHHPRVANIRFLWIWVKIGDWKRLKKHPGKTNNRRRFHRYHLPRAWCHCPDRPAVLFSSSIPAVRPSTATTSVRPQHRKETFSNPYEILPTPFIFTLFSLVTRFLTQHTDSHQKKRTRSSKWLL